MGNQQIREQCARMYYDNSILKIITWRIFEIWHDLMFICKFIKKNSFSK